MTESGVIAKLQKFTISDINKKDDPMVFKLKIEGQEKDCKFITSIVEGNTTKVFYKEIDKSNQQPATSSRGARAEEAEIKPRP